ncbi:TPA: EAL domain-containing protein [Escherichia coli]|nr:EAL domain-containing protein [Escherichia coli]
MLRLQPIFSIAQRKIHGYEVLSTLSPAKNCEFFFSSLSVESHQALLTKQLEIIKQRDGNFSYYLNLPVSLLINLTALIQLIPDLKGNIVIELQDPQNICSLSSSAALELSQNLSLLRINSIPIWLDDISPELFNDIALFSFKFDGIKIDKYAFWELNKSPRKLLDFMDNCHAITKNVSVEGIESILHKKVAIRCGADFLQGFLWPEIRL